MTCYLLLHSVSILVIRTSSLVQSTCWITACLTPPSLAGSRPWTPSVHIDIKARLRFCNGDVFVAGKKEAWNFMGRYALLSAGTWRLSSRVVLLLFILHRGFFSVLAWFSTSSGSFALLVVPC